MAAVPMLIEPQVLLDDLAAAGLDFTLADFANLQISTPDGSRRFMARPAPAFPTQHSGADGLIAYWFEDLPNVLAYAVLYHDGDGTMMQQPLVPLPADWQGLKDRLWQIPGIESVQIGMDGLIAVVIQGAAIHARANHVVLAGSPGGAAGVELLAAGDVNGDGAADLMLSYPNGDRQLLYLYP